MQISQAAFNLIIAEEVSSRAVYEKRYQRPEWPGGMSGVTVAIGYDFGFASETKIRRDWTKRLDQAELNAALSCSGVTGARAESLLPLIRPQIVIPWDEAIDVFTNTDVVEWCAAVRTSLPNTDKLSADSFGALVSLAYNRGASFDKSGDRYSEMRAIKTHMWSEEFYRIPGELRAMKRLWNNGLVGRREREALLFERGLAAKKKPDEPLPPVVTVNEQNRSAASKAAAGTTVATGAGASVPNSQHKSHAGELVALSIALAIGIGVLVYLYRARHRKTPKADPEV